MNQILILGIFLSLAFTELTDLSPGGIIVPAYFAMYLGDPARLAGTAVIALCCMGLVWFLSRFMILYGRRRFAVFVLTGMVLRFLLAPVLGASLSIGYLIPGLLGKDMEKQGALATLLSLAIVTLLISVVITVLERGLSL